jgi:hypothetical protein
MSSQESKKRPSTSAAKSVQKRSKFDPRNISAPPSKVKVEGKRRSAKALVPSESSASSMNPIPSVSSSAGDPGNKTIITESSDSDEVFECALAVNATEAVAMAASDKQKRRANKALLREVGVINSTNSLDKAFLDLDADFSFSRLCSFFYSRLQASKRLY